MPATPRGKAAHSASGGRIPGPRSAPTPSRDGPGEVVSALCACFPEARGGGGNGGPRGERLPAVGAGAPAVTYKGPSLFLASVLDVLMPEGVAELLPELLPTGRGPDLLRRNAFPHSPWPQSGDWSHPHPRESQEAWTHQRGAPHPGRPARGLAALPVSFLHPIPPPRFPGAPRGAHPERVQEGSLGSPLTPRAG